MKAIEWERELAGETYDDTLFWVHTCPMEKSVIHTAVGEECSWCGEKEPAARQDARENVTSTSAPAVSAAPTPETDAKEKETGNCFGDYNRVDRHAYYGWEQARKLERERDEAKFVLGAEIGALRYSLVDTEAERDEAIESFNDMTRSLARTVSRACDAEAERDEARAERDAADTASDELETLLRQHIKELAAAKVENESLRQALINLVARIETANDLHAVFTIKDSAEMKMAIYKSRGVK